MKNPIRYNTKRVTCTIAVHFIQARIIEELQNGSIDFDTDSLRMIAEKINEKSASPQKIKHHLQQLVKLGIVSIIDGYYSYQK